MFRNGAWLMKTESMTHLLTIRRLLWKIVL